MSEYLRTQKNPSEIIYQFNSNTEGLIQNSDSAERCSSDLHSFHVALFSIPHSRCQSPRCFCNWFELRCPLFEWGPWVSQHRFASLSPLLADSFHGDRVISGRLNTICVGTLLMNSLVLWVGERVECCDWKSIDLQAYLKHCLRKCDLNLRAEWVCYVDSKIASVNILCLTGITFQRCTWSKGTRCLLQQPVCIMKINNFKLSTAFRK